MPGLFGGHGGLLGVTCRRRMDMIATPVGHDDGRVLPVLGLILPDLPHDVTDQVGDFEKILDGGFGILIPSEILVELGVLHHVEDHVFDEEALQRTLGRPTRMGQSESGEMGRLAHFPFSPPETHAHMVHDGVLQFFHAKFVCHAIGGRHVAHIKGRVGALGDFASVDPVHNDGEGFRVVFGQIDFILVAFIEAVLFQALFHEWRPVADQAAMEEESLALVSDKNGDNLGCGEAVYRQRIRYGSRDWAKMRGASNLLVNIIILVVFFLFLLLFLFEAFFIAFFTL